MKKLFYLVLPIIMLTFSGCSSDSSSGSEDTYLKFKLNGQQYNFEPETVTSMKILIDGFNSPGDDFVRLALWMPLDLTEGTHPIEISNGSDLEVYSANLDKGDITVDGVGSITITESDGEYLKGTFSFTATDEDGNDYTITEGSFRSLK
jgi:hypothetical protein